MIENIHDAPAISSTGRLFRRSAPMTEGKMYHQYRDAAPHRFLNVLWFLIAEDPYPLT